MGITVPQLLDASHITTAFQCSEKSLELWLKRKALKNQLTGGSRTWGVCESVSRQVVGFYALATGSVQRSSASGAIKRNMPEPIPVIILGRLAVDEQCQRQGIGAGLLKDAVLRAANVSRQVGSRALLVHALSDSAAEFYRYWGFSPSELDPKVLMLSLW